MTALHDRDGSYAFSVGDKVSILEEYEGVVTEASLDPDDGDFQYYVVDDADGKGSYWPGHCLHPRGKPCLR